MKKTVYTDDLGSTMDSDESPTGELLEDGARSGARN